jgi:hypothetical protein
MRQKARPDPKYAHDEGGREGVRFQARDQQGTRPDDQEPGGLRAIAEMTARDGKEAQRHILVVDNERLALGALNKRLRATGGRVTATAGGERARVDAVLLRTRGSRYRRARLRFEVHMLYQGFPDCENAGVALKKSKNIAGFGGRVAAVRDPEGGGVSPFFRSASAAACGDGPETRRELEERGRPDPR